MKKQFLKATLISSLFVSPLAFADHVDATDSSGQPANRAYKHAPLGVMGDHVHSKGEWMVSYRFMRMEMQGNRDGTSAISADEIATTVPNRLAGQMMQPPTLRVVPIEMTMDMHMFGAMYAPTDHLTMMLMVNYLKNEMKHITYAGMTGTNRRGTFTTRSEGFGDAKVSGLYKIYDDSINKVHLNLGISLPTGSITKKDHVLTPMGTTPKLRMPYMMQLGSGTYDLLPGITYQRYQGKWNFGGQYMATIRTGKNSEDYTLGDQHQVTGWAGYSLTPNVSISTRIAYQNVDNIDGEDSEIRAPVQTADPNYYGRDRVDLYAGLNWISKTGHRLALELGAPVYQDLDGPQMETDWSLTAGYQYAF